jgi:hypothetical protein
MTSMSLHWLLYALAVAFALLAFHPTLRRKKVYFVSWLFSAALGALDIWYLVTVVPPAPAINVASILLTWALTPPFVFLLEWQFVGQARTGEGGEYFRYSQELASRFWGGLVIILGLLAQVAMG